MGRRGPESESEMKKEGKKPAFLYGKPATPAKSMPKGKAKGKGKGCK